jgi:uncharacterized damage-inducible protein DinB
MRDRYAIQAAVVAVALSLGPAVIAQGQAKKAPPKPAGTATDEVLAAWNEIGRKIVAMAEDFPENQLDYRPNAQTRSFRGVLLHIAGSNYFFIHSFGGPKIGDDADDPDPAKYKTRADVVAFVKKSFADGAAAIRQQGEAGMQKEVRNPFSNQMVHALAWWYVAVGHGAEHYGNLATYYRVNSLVPPESRR